MEFDYNRFLKLFAKTESIIIYPVGLARLRARLPQKNSMSKSPSLRRIQADIRELALSPSDRYTAAPLESDMFEWHFTIAGPPDSDFSGGLYHGRILLPPDYPFKPPNIVFLTKSGRFETNVKVCLSFSAFHPELWQPAWGIRLILEALIAFLPTPADGAIGSLNYTPEERRKLAKASVNYYCPVCQKHCHELLKQPDNSKASSAFSKEIEALKQMQMLEHKKETSEKAMEEEEGVENEEHQERAEQEGQSEETPIVAEDTVDENNETSEPVVVEDTANEDVTDAQQPMIDEATAPLLQPQATIEPAAQEILQNLTSNFFDPYFHAAIILLSIISLLLLRKIQLLLADLDALSSS